MTLRTLAACLLSFYLFSLAPVQAQERRLAPEIGFGANAPKFIAAGGRLYPRPGPACLTAQDPFVNVIAAELQFSFGKYLAIRGHVSYSFVGRPWMEPPTRAEGLAFGSGEAFEVALKFVVPFRVSPRLVVEPFAGGGINRLLDVDRDEIEGEAVLLEETTDPAFVYGGGLAYQLTGRLEVQAQVQGFLIFAGDQGFLPPDGERFEDDAGTLSGAKLLVGLGFRI